MAQPHLLSRAASVGRSGDLDTQLSAWLDRSASGDAEAFAALYDATSSRIYGLVLTVVRSRCRAAKVTQAVYVEIHVSASTIAAQPAPPMATMLALAHRRAVEDARCHDHEPVAVGVSTLGAARERLPLPRGPRLQDAGPPNTRRLDPVQLDPVQLDPLQQEVLVLAYLGGYTVRQVSVLLSVPAHSVHRAISTALASGLGRARPSPRSGELAGARGARGATMSS